MYLRITKNGLVSICDDGNWGGDTGDTSMQSQVTSGLIKKNLINLTLEYLLPKKFENFQTISASKG